MTMKVAKKTSTTGVHRVAGFCHFEITYMRTHKIITNMQD